MNDEPLLSGEVLEETAELTLSELCIVCAVPAERVRELVDQGAIEPIGREAEGWRFSGPCLRRVRLALRLQHDLGVNAAGAALALDLIEQIELLRARPDHDA